VHSQEHSQKNSQKSRRKLADALAEALAIKLADKLAEALAGTLADTLPEKPVAPVVGTLAAGSNGTRWKNHVDYHRSSLCNHYEVAVRLCVRASAAADTRLLSTNVCSNNKG
jgi:hypothetical protein